MNKLLKDPLSHFLLAGLLLFAALSWLSRDGEQDSQTIVVDRATLLSFIQYRTKVFKPEVAAQRLDAMPEGARQQLERDYIEEEALYRESKSLGLDGDDYVIRRRMVQKLEFISQGFIEQSLQVDEDALATFFQDNMSDYYIEPAITFAHVYLANQSLNPPQQQRQAQRLLQQLNSDGVLFSQAMAHGDRFPFHVNYVERTFEFIESHFGDNFAQQVFELAVPEGSQWLGPIQSQYGLHLVNIKQSVAGRNPQLSEVANMVEQDYRQQLMRAEQQKSVDKVVAQYNVVRP